MTKPIILLILKALEGRGAERMVTTLARAYVEMSYDVHVLCLEDTREMSLDARVRHHVVPYHQPLFEEYSQQEAAYQQVAKRIDDYVLDNIGVPNLILANIYKVNWIMAYSQLPNIVNVLHTALSKQFEHDLIIKPKATIEHLKRVYGAHPCSCVSEGARRDLVALIGNNLNRTTTIYNPCDVDAVRKAATKPLNNETLALLPERYVIHVGSFDSMKGHRDLLQAYARTECKLPLVLVGQGRLENEMKQLTIELGIDKQVVFLGFQPNPYPVIANATLLILSSKFEGFGYVIVEAQALGIPVISTDCPFGPRELLPQNNLVAVGDINGLAKIIDQASANLENYQTELNQQLLPDQVARHYLEVLKAQ